MRCPSCNTVWPDELSSVLKFCGACGAKLEGRIPKYVAPEAPEPEAAPAPTLCCRARGIA